MYLTFVNHKQRVLLVRKNFGCIRAFEVCMIQNLLIAKNEHISSIFE